MLSWLLTPSWCLTMSAQMQLYVPFPTHVYVLLLMPALAFNSVTIQSARCAPIVDRRFRLALSCEIAIQNLAALAM